MLEKENQRKAIKRTERRTRERRLTEDRERMRKRKRKRKRTREKREEEKRGKKINVLTTWSFEIKREKRLERKSVHEKDMRSLPSGFKCSATHCMLQAIVMAHKHNMLQAMVKANNAGGILP